MSIKSKKFYIDTAIWMDYYEDRKDPSKNLGEFAFKLLCALLASKSIIVVSSFLLRELEVAYSIDQIRGLTLPFESLMERVVVLDQQRNEATSISKERNLPKGDALHAILARDAGAILVTRDKHFQSLTDICEVVKPEELI